MTTAKQALHSLAYQHGWAVADDNVAIWVDITYTRDGHRVGVRYNAAGAVEYAEHRNADGISDGTVGGRDRDKRGTVAGWLATPVADNPLPHWSVEYTADNGGIVTAVMAGKTRYHAVRDVHRADTAVPARGNDDGTTTYTVAPYGTGYPMVGDIVTVNGDGIPFPAWLAAIDRILHRAIGLTHSDLADTGYWDGWVACTSPRDMARQAIDGDDTFCGIAGGVL